MCTCMCRCCRLFIIGRKRFKRSLRKYVATNTSAAAVVLQTLRTKVTARPQPTAEKPSFSSVAATPATNEYLPALDFKEIPEASVKSALIDVTAKFVTDVEPPTLDVRPQTLGIKPPTLDVKSPIPDVRPQTLDAKLPTLDIKTPILEAKPPNLEVKPPTLDVKPPSLEVKPPTLDAKPPTLDVRPPTIDVKAEPAVSVKLALSDTKVSDTRPAIFNVTAKTEASDNHALPEAMPIANAKPALLVATKPKLVDVGAKPASNANPVLLNGTENAVVNAIPVLLNVSTKTEAKTEIVNVTSDANTSNGDKINAFTKDISPQKYFIDHSQTSVGNVTMKTVANVYPAVNNWDRSDAKDTNTNTKTIANATVSSKDTNTLRDTTLIMLARLKPISSQILAEFLHKDRNNFTLQYLESSVARPVFQDLMQEKLPPFDPKFKNPCWTDPVSKTLRCLPYVFIIGVKKCGTTSLFGMIRRHSHFADLKFKEAQWFPRTRFANENGLRVQTEPNMDGINNYVNMFDKAAWKIAKKGNKMPISRHSRNPIITGEGSPANLHLNMMWRFIKGNSDPNEPTYVNLDYIHHFLPEARIIIIFRDPVNRLYSDYYHEYGLLRDYPGVGPAHFHEVVTLGLALYRDCLQHYTLRACVYNETILDATRIQIQLGMYSVFWEELTRLYPREQIKVIQLQRLVEDTQNTILDVFLFLKMRRPRLNDWRYILSSHSTNKRLDTYSDRGDMLPDTRTLLQDLYRPFNQQMFQLTKDKEFLYNY